MQEQPRDLAPVSAVIGSPTLFDASQFFSNSRVAVAAEALTPVSGPLVDVQPLSPVQSVPTMRSQPMPVVPKRIDVSFMRPEMVLVPMDLSAAREYDVQIQITPDQWRLLGLVDGQNTLLAACQELAMQPEMICPLAGELIAAGLINVVHPSQLQSMAQMASEFRPAAKETATVSTGSTTPPWSVDMPSPEMLRQHSPFLPSETQSQWGNGGNGATFVLGHGWIASPQPLQPLQPTGSMAMPSGAYAYTGGVN
jgi:hypothetical protein